MRREVIILFILSIICWISNGEIEAQSCGWKTLPNAPTLQDFKHDDIFFVNPDTGWVISGPVNFGDSGNIYKTTDGGNNWISQFAVQGSRFRAMGFLTPLHGFVGNLGPGIYAPVSDTTIFYETQDGGNSWSSVSNIIGPKPEGICGVWVQNDSLIYACGRLQGPSVFLKSTNAGQTWLSQNLDSLAGMLIDVHFFSPDTGIIVGASTTNYASSRGLVLQTFDGGSSWEVKYTTNALGGVCWKIDFPSRNTGYISWETFGPNTIFLKTTDGGNSWMELPFAPGFHSTEAIGFLNDTVGWMGAREEIGFRTTDGGQTWQQGFVGNYLNRFRFISDSLAYACGETVHKFDCSLSGIQNSLPLSQINAFPNPFDDELTIEILSPLRPIKVLLLNYRSELVFEREIRQQLKSKIDLSNCYPGIYLLKVMSGNSIVKTERLVKR